MRLESCKVSYFRYDLPWIFDPFDSDRNADKDKIFFLWSNVDHNACICDRVADRDM